MNFFLSLCRNSFRFCLRGNRASCRSVLAGLAIASAAAAVVSPAEMAWAESHVVGRTLDEIVVMARRREESLQDTPVTVNAFTSDYIDDRGIMTLPELGRYAPNVVIDKAVSSAGPGNSLAVFIRGIGRTDYTLSVDPGVATYVDGVYMSRSIGGVLDLINVQSVEILKGPQGTLFGRNAVGGAINITSQKPHDEFEVTVSATAGKHDRRENSAYLNVPLGDTVFASLSLQHREIDGWVSNLDVGLDGLPNTADDRKLARDWGAEEVDSARIALRWEAGDSVTVDVAADYMDSDADAAPFVALATSAGLNPMGLWNGQGSAFFAGPYDAGAFLTPMGLDGMPIPAPCGQMGMIFLNPETCYTDQWLAGKFGTFSTYDTTAMAVRSDVGKTDGPPEEYDVWGVSVILTWDIDEDLTFKSITGYRETDTNFRRDGDHSPLPVFDTLTPYEHDQFSQEFQFLGTSFDDKLTWILGGYYIEEDGYHVDDIALPGLQLRGGGGIDTEGWAVFGQGSYSLTDALTLTIGARYTDEEKTFMPDILVLLDDGLAWNSARLGLGIPGPDLLGGPLDPPGALTGMVLYPDETTIKSSDTTPYLNLAWDVSDNVSLFATYSEAFKTGGVTQRIADVLPGLEPDAELPRFEPEYVKAYEIGLKSTLAENTLRLNGALFLNKYEDLQVQVFRDASLSVINDNAAESEVLGVEVDFEWLATDALSLYGTLGWMDAEYTELDPDAEAFGITLDHELVNTPEYTANLSASYEISLGDWLLTPRLDWNYRSEMFKDTRNSELIKADELRLWNAAVQLSSPDESLVGTFRVDNLTGENYLLSGGNFSEFGTISGMFDRGRQWSFTLEYNFR